MALFLYAMYVCPITPHYNPFMKMLSYLGRTKIKGVEYPLCHYLFSFALAASAYVSARFFPALSCFVRGSRKKNLFMWAGALNAAGLLAIALVPENVRCDLHNIGCFAAVGGGAIMLLLMTPARNNRRAPGVVRWSLLVWSMALVALFQLSLLGHRHKIMSFSPYVPTLQKMLIMTFVAWLTYYAVVLYRVTRRDIAIPRFRRKLALIIALGALAATADLKLPDLRRPDLVDGLAEMLNDMDPVKDAPKTQPAQTNDLCRQQ